MEFNTFIDKFDELLGNIEAESPFCTVIMGDFNSHLKEWYQGDKNDVYGMAMQKLLKNHGISQLVDQPTFITRNAKTCIDLVVTNQPNLILLN